jgi:hypothetical protein
VNNFGPLISHGQDKIAATENSLAYQCGTSKLGEKYNSCNKFEGSDTSEWIQILEESSGLDFQSIMPVSISMLHLYFATIIWYFGILLDGPSDITLFIN